MRPHALQTDELDASHLGWVLAHDLHGPDGERVLRKGTRLDTAALQACAQATLGEVHLLELVADDVHEDVAGLRIAQAIAGAGLTVAGPTTSRYDLVVEGKGLLRVQQDLLRTLNRIDDVTIYTVLDRQPVLPGKPVASVKVTPLAMPEERVAAVERHCRTAQQPLLEVVPFIPRRVAVLAAEPLTTDQHSRFRASLERKLGWYGSTLIDLREVPLQTEPVAEALRAFLDAGAELILAGGGSTIDPLDPVELALARVGAHIVHRGGPTRGSMCWLARAGAVQFLNLASCAMWTGNTIGDLLLPLLHTARAVTQDDIREIGYGGLLGTEMAFRFPPYDRETDEPSR